MQMGTSAARVRPDKRMKLAKPGQLRGFAAYPRRQAYGGRKTRRLRRIIIAILLIPAGCSTFTYKSERSAFGVAECIAGHWRKSGATSIEVPVSLTKTDNTYFVGVELGYVLNPIPLGWEHPGYAVWAEVRDSGSGSETKYHRALQIMHGKIDRAVRECQHMQQR